MSKLRFPVKMFMAICLGLCLTSGARAAQDKPEDDLHSGAFITFVATAGSGYVRIILSDFKEAASLTDETEKKYDYVEHMLIGSRSVTYYGTKQ